MKMYDSLKEAVQESLQRSKANPTAPGGTKGNNASMLNDAVEELEKFVAYRIGQLKAAVRESAAVLAGEAQHAEQVIDGLKTNIAALEAKLRETEEAVRDKDATIKSLEQDNSAKIHELENQLKTKEKLLTNRSREVIDLKAQLEHLRNGIKEMSSFFKQSEVLGAMEGQDNSAVSGKGESKTAGAQAKGKAMASPTPDAAQENVSPEFFEKLTLELTQTIGPMAPLIVRDHVKSLGETIEQFPKARVKELLETVSSEILDDKVKTGFRERIAQINGHA